MMNKLRGWESDDPRSRGESRNILVYSGITRSVVYRLTTGCSGRCSTAAEPERWAA